MREHHGTRGCGNQNRDNATTAQPQSLLGESHMVLNVSLVSMQLLDRSSKLKKAHAVSLESLYQNGGTRPLSEEATAKERAAQRGCDQKGTTWQEDGSPFPTNETWVRGSTFLMAPARVVLSTLQPSLKKENEHPVTSSQH